MSCLANRCARGLLLLLAFALTGCSATPAQKQRLADDAARVVASFAACVKVQASQPNATAETISVTCAGSVLPEVVALAVDAIAVALSRSFVASDAGAP